MGIPNCKSAIQYLVLIGLLFFAHTAWAKDLFVAPTGNDSVPYTSNDIANPWASPQFAWENALAGDTVYFRGGTYSISAQINTKFVGNDGTATMPIIFRNYPGESVTFSSNVQTVFLIERDYNFVRGIKFTGQASMWFNIGYDTLAEGFEISDCEATMGTGGDNMGFVNFGLRAPKSKIERCRIVGPGLQSQGVHGNTAGILIFRTSETKVLNNEISNAPIGIYYKHANNSDPADIEIAYNYIDTVDRFSIFLNSNYAYVHDNVIGPDANATFNLTEDNGVTGGNYNIIDHNTVIGGRFAISCDNSMGLNNMVTNNIFINKVEYHRYCATPHETTSDYNLYGSNPAVIENRIDYSLSSWKTYYQAKQGHGTDESHSLSGTPLFRNYTNKDFTLMPISPGAKAASNGKAMGANIQIVGPNPAPSVPITLK